MTETKKAEAPAIEDETFIKAKPERVFKALTEGKEIAKWWPKAAESDPKAGGKLTLTWFNGSKCETKFETFEPGKEVSYKFYTEHLTFKLTEKGEGTAVKIVHRCGPEAAIHVAQCWGFLKANLKSVIEYGNDLR